MRTFESGRQDLPLKGHTGWVNSVAFPPPDGKRIASGSWDNTIKVWDAASGREVMTLKGHTGSVSFVVFSPDGKRLVSGSQDNNQKGIVSLASLMIRFTVGSRG